MTAAKYPKVVGYELVERIGGGGFSQVFRAVNLSDHRVAACKVLLLTRIRPTKSARQSRKRCVSYDAALKHRNILEVVDAVIVELKHPHHYVPGLYMLLELAAGGGLFDKIAPDVGVGDEVAHFYLLQPTARWNGIYLQRGRVPPGPEAREHPPGYRGDAQNLGLWPVLCLQAQGDRSHARSDRAMRQSPYVAPELNSDQPYEAEPIDLWGIGVILYTLLAGNTPWDEPTQNSPESARYLSGAIFHERPWGLEPLQRGGSLVTPGPAHRGAQRAVHARRRLPAPVVQPVRTCLAWTALCDPDHDNLCAREPSQLAKQGAAALAQALTQSLRTAGDMDLAAPDLSARTPSADDAADVPMPSAPHQTQFTQGRRPNAARATPRTARASTPRTPPARSSARRHRPRGARRHRARRAARARWHRRRAAPARGRARRAPGGVPRVGAARGVRPPRRAGVLLRDAEGQREPDLVAPAVGRAHTLYSRRASSRMCCASAPGRS